MGKAALDLPDPLQSPPPGTQTSTDDLLAQLAGEEIDRLLAEAESVEAATPAAPAAAAPVAIPVEEPATSVASAAPAGPILRDEAPSDAPMGNGAVNIDPGAPAEPDAGPDVAAELDELFNTAVARDKADEEAATALAAVAAPVAPSPAAVPAATAQNDGTPTTAAERVALTTPVADATPAPTTGAAPTVLTEPLDDDRPTPLYLRPLEWLNAPLAAFPPTVRDLIGKVAIVTLFNAAAIIVYVMLFRRG